MFRKANAVALCFASIFAALLIMRIETLNTIDIVFYSIAILGFVLLGVAPLFTKKKH